MEYFFYKSRASSSRQPSSGETSQGAHNQQSQQLPGETSQGASASQSNRPTLTPSTSTYLRNRERVVSDLFDDQMPPPPAPSDSSYRRYQQIQDDLSQVASHDKDIGVLQTRWGWCSEYTIPGTNRGATLGPFSSKESAIEGAKTHRARSQRSHD